MVSDSNKNERQEGVENEISGEEPQKLGETRVDGEFMLFLGDTIGSRMLDAIVMEPGRNVNNLQILIKVDDVAVQEHTTRLENMGVIEVGQLHEQNVYRYQKDTAVGRGLMVLRLALTQQIIARDANDDKYNEPMDPERLSNIPRKILNEDFEFGQEDSLVSVFGESTLTRILQILVKESEMSRSDLADCVGASESTVRDHTQHLEQMGVVKTKQSEDGDYNLYRFRKDTAVGRALQMVERAAQCYLYASKNNLTRDQLVNMTSPFRDIVNYTQEI